MGIGPGNGLSPVQCQAITWTNADLLSIGPLGTNFSAILIETLTFSFKKMCLKISSAKWSPFCSERDELSVIWFQLWTHSGLPFIGPYVIWFRLWTHSRLLFTVPIGTLKRYLVPVMDPFPVNVHRSLRYLIPVMDPFPVSVYRSLYWPFRLP